MLRAAGLRTIENYVNVRQKTVAEYITRRPVFNMVKRAVWRRGTAPRQYWWDQDLDYEAPAEDFAPPDLDKPYTGAAVAAP